MGVNLQQNGGGGGSTLPNTQAPTNTIPVAVTSLAALGDSITYGLFLGSSGSGTPSVGGYAGLFADYFNLTIASNGAQTNSPRYFSAGFAQTAYGLSPTAAVATITNFGANESGDFTTGISQMIIGMRALMVWCALPSAAIVMAAAATKVGFASNNTYTFQTNYFSSTANDTITATVNGTTVYVAGNADTAWGTATLLIDGVSQGTISFVNTTVASGGIVPVCYRFSGLSSGNHTVQVKVTSGICTVAWFAGNQGGGQAPLVIAGGMIPHTGVSAGNISTFNTALQAEVTNLKSDGLNVVYVNSGAGLSTTSAPLMYVDGIHPNEYGASVMAKNWIEAFQTPTSYPNIIATGGDFLAQTLNAIGYTPARVASLLNSLDNFVAYRNNYYGPATLDAALCLTPTGLNAITAGKVNGTPFACVKNGVPFVVANGDYTAQAAAKTSTLAFAVPASQSGFFRVSYTASVTQAATSSSTLGGTNGFQVSYTDADDSNVKTSSGGTTSAGNTTGTQISGVITVNAKTSTNINFTFDYTSSGATAMQYNLHVRVEYIG